MNWAGFEVAHPELAALALEEIDRNGMALLGTVRRDGTPRIGSVRPCVVQGELLLGMLWQSRKALDLLRDPRLVLRNAVCTNRGDERELSIRGRVRAIEDRDLRAQFVRASEAWTDWKEPHFHLFAVDIESAALVAYGRGQQSVELWPQGKRSTEPYG